MKIMALFALWLFAVNTSAAEPLVLSVGASCSRFDVALSSNPTTGYQWQLKSYNKKQLKVKGMHYLKPSSTLIGAGGKAVFSFSLSPTAPRPSHLNLLFEYKRPWEKKAVAIQPVIVYLLKEKQAASCSCLKTNGKKC